ncbi:MAG: YdeI/OmpD-associated family protein [Burkholderiales bacterium]|nr:YdeI/OmpD-associated family protein [Burkholderiales bacterium]
MPTSPATADLRDPRVDTYIAQAAPFAQAPLARIRDAMHAALPDVAEAIKWGHPFFLLEGRPFANMAAFKAHCALGFWRGGRPVAEEAAGDHGKAMGQFGRIESVADLPKPAALRKLIVEARAAWTAAIEDKASAPAAPKAKRAPPAVPDDLAAALRATTGARKRYDAFTPSQQAEYVDWIVEARREATRASRIAQAVEWIAEGKTRNWKYQNC